MKKVRNCIICDAPTVANNRLCKKVECLTEQLKRRIHIVSDNPPKSGVFISLTRCTHNISLEEECTQCDTEWKQAQTEGSLPSEPRIPINPRIEHGKDSEEKDSQKIRCKR